MKYGHRGGKWDNEKVWRAVQGSGEERREEKRREEKRRGEERRGEERREEERDCRREI